MILYENLEKHFKLPKNFTPGKGGYYSRYKRIPRKIKKKATKLIKTKYPFLEIEQALWYLLSIHSKDYHRFLIKKVIES
jgi:hypothetical protein